MERMYAFIDIIKECSLFSGIEENELSSLLQCLSANYVHFNKNEFIFLSGDKVTSIGIVLSGNVHIIQEDFWGKRTILSDISPGFLFGESFSCSDEQNMPVSVIASVSSDIMLIDYKKIINNCPSGCAFHSKLIKNMVNILASKNVLLTQKIEFLTQRTTREKLLAYFSMQAQRFGASKFSIPFNRQELADYLSVERSAMSSELSKMRNDGIILFNKNQFELLK